MQRLGLRGKGEVYPTTSHEVPEREEKYICALSLTSVLDGVEAGIAQPV
jgi:hypothetical protein